MSAPPRTSLIFTLLALSIAIVAGVVLVALYLRRRFGATWSTFGWGAASFVVSQVVRLPLLFVTGLIANPVALVLTSGLFEETTRYAILRFGHRTARRWRDGVMFGVGHGGIEATLLTAGSMLSSVFLLVAGDSVLEATRAADPGQAQVVAEQLASLRDTPWWMPFLGFYERIPAMAFHVVASLLVLRAVTSRQFGWLVAAVVLHIALNGVTLLALGAGGPVLAEVALTLFVLGMVWVIPFSMRWFADPDQPLVVPEPPAEGDQR